MRTAISPERSALPLRRLDKVGRETRSARAAAVTVSPAASTISVLIKSPGWGGFFIGMACLHSSSVIIFQVHIEDFALGLIKAKSQAPVCRYAKAPRSLALTGQRMRFPRRKSQ